MEKLELKHSASYLPYNVMVTNGNEFVEITTRNIQDLKFSKEFKLILKPLSDLTKNENKLKVISWFKYDDVQITEYIGGKELTLTATYKILGDVFTDFIISRNKIDNTNYWIVQELLKNHYDVFGLIKLGLAVDINTL